MSDQKSYNRAEDWVLGLQTMGKYAFSLSQFRADFPNQSDIANKFALKRLVDKKQIVSVHKGHYLIIPPAYRSKGILPPALFLDAFMQQLNRPYYVALLSAAALHGASHQQPQEFFVVTNFPVLRPTEKKGLKINYISKKEIPTALLDTLKSEAGYYKVSNPALTAADLVHFAKRVGGLNRVVTILAELVESIRPQAFDEVLVQYVAAAGLQRLGYLLERVLHEPVLADALYLAMQSKCIALFRVPLKTAAPVKGCAMDEKWKVIVNVSLEIDA